MIFNNVDATPPSIFVIGIEPRAFAHELPNSSSNITGASDEKHQFEFDGSPCLISE